MNSSALNSKGSAKQRRVKQGNSFVMKLREEKMSLFIGEMIWNEEGRDLMDRLKVKYGNDQQELLRQVFSHGYACGYETGLDHGRNDFRRERNE